MRTAMRKRLLAMGVGLLTVAGMAMASSAAVAATAERYLHVRVEDGTNGQSVNVNVPLSLAEKILPAVNNNGLHNGCVTIHESDFNGVDVRAILDAIRTAPDNEFVTVKGQGQDVHVMKSNGNIVVRVRDGNTQKVDVTVPMKVVDALFSTVKDNQLNVAAAVHALGEAGDTLIVSVEDSSQHVRVWVDSRNTQDSGTR